MSIPIGTQVFDKCDPLVHAGDMVTITPSYQLNDGHDLLTLSGPSGVKLQVEGPRLKVEPADVAGVYPTPGSDDSPADYLPHIAFNRRTFPWERSGPKGKPWLALLMAKASEITLVSTTVAKIAAIDAASSDRFLNKMKLPASTPIYVANLTNAVLEKILPTLAEIELLCHMKRIVFDDSSQRDMSIVMGNRLPTVVAGQQPEPHTVMLVSLEQCDDLYGVSENFAKGITGVTSLPVLYSWNFTPSQGKDFEQVMKSIRIRPNGGVLRFGSEAWDADKNSVPLTAGFQPLLKSDGYPIDPLPHDPPGNVEYRGPLCPFPLSSTEDKSIAVRSAPEEFDDNSGVLDYSYASAFELGRLLALADSSILQALFTIYNLPDRIFHVDMMNPLPDILQIPDWVQNHPDWEQPWGQQTSLIKSENTLLQKGLGDVTGILSQLQQAGWQAGILTPLTAAGQASPIIVSEINLDTVQMENLAMTFPEVRTANN